MVRSAYATTCRLAVKVTFWGVRGSIPTSSAATVRYGGHTSCVSVRVDGGPPLVFDMGTGARLLGKSLRVLKERCPTNPLWSNQPTRGGSMTED